AASGAPPSGRYAMAAVYDPDGDRLVVFGGFDDAYAYRNDVWALTLSGTPAWIKLAPSGTPPSPRGYVSAVYDAPRKRMLVYGGSDGRSLFGDVWALSLVGPPTWSQVAASGTAPSPRAQVGLGYDSTHDRLIVFAGSSTTDYVKND